MAAGEHAEPGWRAGLRRLRRALRPPRRAIPTRPGWFALVAPMFLGVAAVTATNNLLFMILGASLGAVVLSGVLSERVVRPLEVRVAATAPSYAGEPTPIEVRLRRSEVGAPAFDLRFREVPSRWTLRRPQPGRFLEVRIPVLEGLEAAAVGTRVFDERGKASLLDPEITTRYPFGLLEKTKDVEAPLELWVRPRRVSAPTALVRPRSGEGEGAAARRRGAGLDVYGLRERDDRDPLHRVHALRSLSLGREVVLQMADEHEPTAHLGVATGLSADPVAFERALEVAQAVLIEWDQAGFAVGLSTHDGVLEPGRYPLGTLLDHLAKVRPRSRPRWLGAPSTWLVPEGSPMPAEGAAFAVDAGGGVRPLRGVDA